MELSHTNLTGGLLLCWLAHWLVILIICEDKTHIRFLLFRHFIAVSIIYIWLFYKSFRTYDIFIRISLKFSTIFQRFSSFCTFLKYFRCKVNYFGWTVQIFLDILRIFLYYEKRVHFPVIIKMGDYDSHIYDFFINSLNITGYELVVHLRLLLLHFLVQSVHLF